MTDGTSGVLGDGDFCGIELRPGWLPPDCGVACRHQAAWCCWAGGIAFWLVALWGASDWMTQ